MKRIASKLRALSVGLIGGVAAALLAANAQAVENFRLSTLGPGTSPYVVMTTFANIVNEHLPEYQVQVNATGAATRHAVETAMGRSDFFMTAPIVHHMMRNSIGPYTKVPNSGKLAEELRVLFYFPMGYYHIVTYADSGITSLEDLRGKRVFLGPPGGSAQKTMTLFIEGMTGMRPNEDYEEAPLSWDAAVQSFRDGHIDVYINPTLPPSPVIVQMALLKQIRLLGMPPGKVDGPAMKKMLDRPGFRIGEIRPDAYGENQVNESPVLTFGSTVGIASSKDVSEEAAYRMTKAFWENIEARAKNIPVLRNIALETALRDINMPLHPGALRYYREIGMEIPDEALPG